MAPTWGDRPPPAVPDAPVIAISGVVPVSLRRCGWPELATLPRLEIVADFHCVSGWTATDLRWEGVRFADFFRAFVEPALDSEVSVSHLTFVGLDGINSVGLGAAGRAGGRRPARGPGERAPDSAAITARRSGWSARPSTAT